MVSSPTPDAEKLRGICARLIAGYREPVKGLAPKPLTIEDAVAELLALLETARQESIQHYMDTCTAGGIEPSWKSLQAYRDWKYPQHPQQSRGGDEVKDKS